MSVAFSWSHYLMWEDPSNVGGTIPYSLILDCILKRRKWGKPKYACTYSALSWLWRWLAALSEFLLYPHCCHDELELWKTNPFSSKLSLSWCFIIVIDMKLRQNLIPGHGTIVMTNTTMWLLNLFHGRNQGEFGLSWPRQWMLWSEVNRSYFWAWAEKTTDRKCR